MIGSLAGLVLNAFSIIVLSAMLVIGLTSFLLMTNLLQRLNLSAHDRCRVFWLIVLAPWLVGVSATFIVIVLSQPQIFILFNSDLIHWHHLNEFYWKSWHGALVLIAILFLVLMVVRIFRRVAALTHTIELLSSFSRARPDGVLELDSDICAAFTAGLSKPQCYMTKALIDKLNENEYEVIRVHEMSHVQSRDPARRAWFVALAGFYPSVIARFLISQMITATEQLADARVIAENSDRAFIARVLLKVHGLVKQASPDNNTALGICHFGSESIVQRITYMLSENEKPPISLAAVFMALSLLALGCAIGADALHHTIDAAMAAVMPTHYK